MTHQNPKITDEVIKNQEDEFSGEETFAGDDPVPGSIPDTESALEDSIGNEIDDTKPLEIAKEIDKDEQQRVPGQAVNESAGDLTTTAIDEDESLVGAAGASENLVESTDDPFENLTDADFNSSKKDK